MSGPGREALGIGQVGLGGISAVHRAGYRDLGQPVVAGADPDTDARDRMAADTPGATAYTTVEELLADPAVMVVDLATPHHRQTRYPLVEQIAAAGKPMLIQKPLAMSYAEALELVEVCERAGVPAMVNQNMCFTPAALTLQDVLLRERRIGSPTYAQIQMQYRFDTGEHPWFGRDTRWWTIGLTVHHLGLLQLLFGPPETVYAMTGHDRTQPGVAVDGHGHLALTYPDGLQVLLASTGTYYGTNEIRHGDEAMWIQGPDGLIDWNPGTGLVLSRRTDNGIARETIPPAMEGSWFPHAFGLAMAHFRQSLRYRRNPMCAADDNLAVMAVVEAAYRAASERRVVGVPEIMGRRYRRDYGNGWSYGFADWSPPTIGSGQEGPA